MADSAVHPAALAISAGEPVAFPTETVYGLGANASSDAAVATIFALKGRPSDHPLIVHLANPSEVAHFASAVPAFAQQLIATFWPGPLTVILPRRPGVASAAAGGQDSIGLRCPAHPVALSLLRECQTMGVRGVAAPSANRFGHMSPTTAAHVRAEFGDALRVLDGGECEVGIESAIVDCTRGVPVLLRPGVLTLKQLEAACGQRVFLPHEPLLNSQLQEAVDSARTSAPNDAPRASGTLISHYAPRARLRLVSPSEALALQALQDKAYRKVYVLPSSAAQAAHELFARLRQLDQPGVQEIVVSEPPAGQDWDGVRDRLTRAAA